MHPGSYIKYLLIIKDKLTTPKKQEKDGGVGVAEQYPQSDNQEKVGWGRGGQGAGEQNPV